MGDNNFWSFKYARAALVAAFFVYLILWLADTIGSFIGGFIASIPLALPLIYFLEDDQVPGYSLALTLGIIAYLFAALTLLYIFNYLHWGKITSIIVAMGVWFIIAIPIFYYYWWNPPNFIDNDDDDDLSGEENFENLL